MQANRNQWFASVHFLALTLPEKLNLLLTQRERLFQQQDELLERRTALDCQQRELLERQTKHELQCHLFWRRLQQGTDEPDRDETEAIPATEHL